MKPHANQFEPVYRLAPGMPTVLPATEEEPLYLNIGQNDVLRLDFLGQNGGWNVPALLVDPDSPDVLFEGIRYGKEHDKTIGRGLGRIGLALSTTASRNHLNIYLDSTDDGGSVYVLEDLGSTNGTTVVRPADGNSSVPFSQTELAKHDTAVSMPFIRHEKLSSPLDLGYSSRPSEKHPSWNEDSFVVNHEGIYGVFDGVGGSVGGVEASTLAAHVIQEEVMANVMGNAHELSKQAYSLILKDAIKSADKKLFQKGRGNGFLTTATVMLQTPWGETVVANAGDSRAYVMRKGKLMPLTKDNAYGAVFDGPLSGDETYPQRVLSEMEFTNDNTDPNIRHAFHHRNLISSYLGIGMSDDASAISITYFMPQPGDIVLLTTDGVHDNLKDSEIEKIVHDNSVKAADELALLLTNNAHATSKKDRTLSHRPKSDDMTAVVVKY